ncbi:DNA-methyltransferase [Rhizobium rhizogenes]|uniref:DNA-methyltransferase n=1 Tax=Rhizobium rhizogenes TaxID=359 RepID=UPI00068C41D0|nr:site-specific DNA-methyltransferase [Rhizobium rhizogenes]NTJ22225.1 site-specific DNA-methyltransferase [Rhizobium rhizogenes]QUE80944.1 site-specific DNA-methyltransferase [Rhizobium rhizogenes]TQO80950.1 site-specific DNA-methyltransferase [Rhizobium rhizogenes]TRB51544.1 site-specific DNA-methyltransferase [Rhizobium rhizogenes]
MIEPRSFLDGKVTLYGGDNRDVLKQLADNSIDSIVTDPPYALVSIVKRFGKPGSAPAAGNDAYQRASAGFMGANWDTGEVAFSEVFWAECLRVLKPGGHVVAFSGTRTYHRMAVAIEDAGFEVRDRFRFEESFDTKYGPLLASMNDEQRGALLELLNDYCDGGSELAWEYGSGFPKSHNQPGGLGTALKPSYEPICLARKSLVGTVASNIAEWGTGALNVDGCRVGDEVRHAAFTSLAPCHGNKLGGADTAEARRGTQGEAKEYTGRWPANIIHDGSDEVIAAFPDAPGQQRSVGPQHGAKDSVNVFGDYGPRDDFAPRLDSGSAARFFYSAKADKLDRLGSKHPTVKPVDLMQWLVRLVTPKGGVVLDPFAGSGSTGEAAWREGMQCILVEREEEYQADIAERLRLADAGPVARRARAIKQVATLGPLFGDNDNEAIGGGQTDIRKVRGSTTGLSGQSVSSGKGVTP